MIVNRDKYLPLLRIDDSFMKYVIQILYDNLNKRVCQKS